MIMALTLHSSIYCTAACMVSNGLVEGGPCAHHGNSLAIISACSNQEEIFSLKQCEVLCFIRTDKVTLFLRIHVRRRIYRGVKEDRSERCDREVLAYIV
jgi:hypothetical protein